ncbi:MAG TPA: flagellar biosynthetic protein FliO [Bauldia sp.]|nr:flagellar biosynthetic protein FliO [Bauldia sp.]
MFGSWGGMILQFTITLVVVLALIAVAYWLVRRYSAGGLGRIGRGRVPRLAVIDAMPVDGRRKLVLVRRDNIEHLILVGGPTDVVVEQAIQRPRLRPAAKPQSAPMPAPAANDPLFDPPAPAVETAPPMPFPQRSSAPPPPPPFRPDPATPPPAASYSAPTPQPIERPYPPLRRASPPPARAEAPPPPPATPQAAPTVVQFEPMADAAPLFPDLPQAPTYEETQASAFGRRLTDFNGNGAGPEEAPEPEPNPFAAPADDTAAKVNDLEREMARLLGEITAKRP